MRAAGPPQGAHCAPPGGSAAANAASEGAHIRRQRGISLLLVLVVLGVLLLAAAALLRSTETAALIAGNITFKQAALQAADIAVNRAVTDLANRADLDTTVPGVYMAAQLAADASGLPTAVDWSAVPSQTYGNLKLQWIVDRLCVPPLPVANPIAQCQVNDAATNGSNKVGSPDYHSATTYFYRITVRARGPKNAESFVQSIVSR